MALIETPVAPVALPGSGRTQKRTGINAVEGTDRVMGVAVIFFKVCQHTEPFHLSPEAICIQLCQDRSC